MNLERAIGDFTRHLAGERGFSENTVRSYRSDLAALTTFAETRAVTEVSGLDLELLRDWLWQSSSEGLVKSTLARRGASARAFSSWLADRKSVV